MSKGIPYFHNAPIEVSRESGLINWQFAGEPCDRVEAPTDAVRCLMGSAQLKGTIVALGKERALVRVEGRDQTAFREGSVLHMSLSQLMLEDNRPVVRPSDDWVEAYLNPRGNRLTQNTLEARRQHVQQDEDHWLMVREVLSHAGGNGKELCVLHAFHRVDHPEYGELVFDDEVSVLARARDLEVINGTPPGMLYSLGQAVGSLALKHDELQREALAARKTRSSSAAGLDL